MRISQIFVSLSWIPLALFAWAYWQISHLDGWSAWAAGSVFLPIVWISMLMGLTGAILWFREWRGKRHTLPIAAATLLAGSVAIFFLVKSVIIG
ncbi:hypothetical protein [Chlorobaculum parvum]|uniref:hypothetical protein n=1 Tax=Chlorobaculum parvum TaxID=274539 RepID=UPI00059EC3D2|nr:hypothetical protein [Chlorobaculum parvum]